MKNILKATGAAMITCLFAACDDMSSVYQEYLDRGERIYIGIADSLTINPGNLRAVVEWKIDADPKLKETIIKWGDNDSIIVPIVRNGKGTQWLSKEIVNLYEGSLTFISYNRDIYGNCSLHKEKAQTIYGSKYIANLNPRKIASIDVMNPDKLIMKWNSMDNCTGVNFHYQTRGGDKKDLFIKPDQEELVLTDFALGGDYSYETLYKPVENCLEDLVTATKADKFPAYYSLDTSGWTATASSDKAGDDGGSAEVLIDGIIGDADNYWHSQWGPDEPLPHWILIDMQKEYNINEVQVYKRLDNTDCKDLNLKVALVSDDENFEEIGKLTFDNTATPNGKSLVLDKSVKARYLKCEITDSWRPPYVSLSEIKILGSIIE